ncbi:MAG: hypothetical protein GX660_03825 [Clostridiaceae bacterium]|nr:hypothetical protein [Clostridiaceae bacterium]
MIDFIWFEIEKTSIMDKQDAKILDAVLKIAVAYNGSNYESILGLAGNYDCPEIAEYSVKEFIYYLDIIEEYNIANVTKYKSGFTVKPYPIKTEKFINNGGLTGTLEENDKLLEITSVENQKLINEATLAKWQVKAFWPLFIFALIGGVSGFVSLIMQIFKD